MDVRELALRLVEQVSGLDKMVSIGPTGWGADYTMTGGDES